MADIAYIDAPGGPFEIGEYRGDPIMLFGAYRVRLEDGFTHLTPHTGFAGTVSEMPLPLDDPGVRAELTKSAEMAREHAVSEEAG